MRVWPALLSSRRDTDFAIDDRWPWGSIPRGADLTVTGAACSFDTKSACSTAAIADGLGYIATWQLVYAIQGCEQNKELRRKPGSGYAGCSTRGNENS